MSPLEKYGLVLYIMGVNMFLSERGPSVVIVGLTLTAIGFVVFFIGDDRDEVKDE